MVESGCWEDGKRIRRRGRDAPPKGGRARSFGQRLLHTYSICGSKHGVRRRGARRMSSWVCVSGTTSWWAFTCKRMPIRSEELTERMRSSTMETASRRNATSGVCLVCDHNAVGRREKENRNLFNFIGLHTHLCEEKRRHGRFTVCGKRIRKRCKRKGTSVNVSVNVECNESRTSATVAYPSPK